MRGRREGVRGSIGSVAIVVILLLAVAGCGDPSADPGGDEATDASGEPSRVEAGEHAALLVAAADRVVVRQGGTAWPAPGIPDAWDDAAIVAEFTDPGDVAALVEVLEEARYIDLGAVDYDQVPPDYQVGLLDGDEVLEVLGYYEDVSRWGEDEVEGRWTTAAWDPLAVTVALPTSDF